MKSDDKRRTCRCGHRYRDHGFYEGTGMKYRDDPGGKCLAWTDDPGKSSLQLCTCNRYQPWPDDPDPLP